MPTTGVTGSETALISELRDDGGMTAVAELEAGRNFAGRYACRRKDRLTTKNGSAYLALELADRTGSISARLFRDVDRIGARFARGDAIQVRGRVERFQGQLSAEIEEATRIEPGDFDPADFLPSTYRDREELEGFLEHFSREIHDEPLRAVVEAALFRDEEMAQAFRLAPCTRAGHHAYLGGLLEHTVAVATLAAETCLLHPRLNSDLLLAAALLHDLGKTREFTYGAEIGLSDEGRMLGHLQLGTQLLHPLLESLDDDRRTTLTACILCHHGTEPLRLRAFPSAEAIALYRLNALDSQVKTALEHGIERWHNG